MNVGELYRLTAQEIKQREEEGCEVQALRTRHQSAEGLFEEAKRSTCEQILDKLGELLPDARYTEPSGLAELRAERPAGPRRLAQAVSAAELYERTYGAWLGRCAGCLLGKPVENASREYIRKMAIVDSNWPLRDYFSAIARPRTEGDPRLLPGNPCTRGNITHMERDDDIDYTIAGLLLLERHGLGFTTEDVAAFWLSELPFHKVYTAERVAYRNLVDGIPPQRCGEVLNPCREWIGAQIRADAFGYACPGWPELAAELAYRDAYLSHRKNGIYGEMFVAAMIAAAFVESDIHKIIEIGLSEIPARTRLTEAVQNVVAWWDQASDWEDVADHIDAHYGDLQGCHTITNAAIVILGLLAGEADFSAGLAIAIMPGYDTDCNGATVGSILGVRAGATHLPAHWTDPLHDRVDTIVASVHTARISDLARRTVQVAVDQLAKSAT